MAYYPPKARTWHLRDASADISGYKRLVMLPQTVETEATLTGASSGSSEVLIGSFVSDVVGVTSLDAGVWRFNLKAKVDSATDTTQIKIYVYSRDIVGAETALFNVTSAEINDTTVAAVTVNSASQSAFTTSVSDRVVVKFYALSNSGSAKTVTLYYQGATNYSTILLPGDIPVREGDMTKFVYDPDGDSFIDWAQIANKPLFETLFLHDDPSDIATYERLLTTPAGGTEYIDTGVCNAAGGEVLIDAYATEPPQGLGITQIHGGTWTFTTWCKVDNATGTSEIIIRVYKRNQAGTETELFNTTTGEINDTTVVAKSTSSTQDDFLIDEADRLVVKYLAKTTSVVDRTVSLYYEGTTHYSHIAPPSLTGGAGGGGDISSVGDTSTVNLTLNAGELTADVIPGGIKLDDLGAPDDNTDLNVSTSAHGLVPKLSFDGSQYLDGLGGWTIPDDFSGTFNTSDDMDDFITTATYYARPVTDSLANCPTTTNGIIRIKSNGSGTGYQTYVAIDGIFYFRTFTGGTFTAWTANIIGGITYADDDVSNPPTQEELTTAFGAPVTFGQGTLGLLDDGGLGTKQYLCASDGTYWNFIPFLRAASSLAYADYTRYGIVLAPGAGEDDYVVEPSVIIEDGVWKMWYRYDFTNPNVGYATSPDGINWTKYASNPVIDDHYTPFVFKYGDTYHFYGANTSFNAIDHYTSSDGISWSVSQAGAVSLGADGAWDDQALGNMFVWLEASNDWRMIYEAKGGVSDPWQLGYATSSDGDSWSKSGSNPVINPTGSIGGPHVVKHGSTYYLWAHESATGFLPTDIVRYYSTNLTSWTSDGIMIARTGADEGAGSGVGQVADPFIIVYNGVMYLYYEGSPDGDAGTGTTNIKLITAKESLIWA